MNFVFREWRGSNARCFERLHSGTQDTGLCQKDDTEYFYDVLKHF